MSGSATENMLAFVSFPRLTRESKNIVKKDYRVKPDNDRRHPIMTERNPIMTYGKSNHWSIIRCQTEKPPVISQ